MRATQHELKYQQDREIGTLTVGSQTSHSIMLSGAKVLVPMDHGGEGGSTASVCCQVKVIDVIHVTLPNMIREFKTSCGF